MGSCAAPSAKGDDKFITTDYLQQCRVYDITEQGRTALADAKTKVKELFGELVEGG